jgi:hypothetical protein
MCCRRISMTRGSVCRMAAILAICVLIMFLDCDGDGTNMNVVVAFTAQQSMMDKMIQINDKLPMIDLHYGFPPQYVNSAFYAANKNVLILCLPGAFTPT